MLTFMRLEKLDRCSQRNVGKTNLAAQMKRVAWTKRMKVSWRQ